MRNTILLCVLLAACSHAKPNLPVTLIDLANPGADRIAVGHSSALLVTDTRAFVCHATGCYVIADWTPKQPEQPKQQEPAPQQAPSAQTPAPALPVPAPVAPQPPKPEPPKPDTKPAPKK